MKWDLIQIEDLRIPDGNLHTITSLSQNQLSYDYSQANYWLYITAYIRIFSDICNWLYIHFILRNKSSWVSSEYTYIAFRPRAIFHLVRHSKRDQFDILMPCKVRGWGGFGLGGTPNTSSPHNNKLSYAMWIHLAWKGAPESMIYCL